MLKKGVRWGFSFVNYNKSEIVANVNAKQMFELIRDVPNYPSFLKYIDSSRIVAK